MQHLIGLGYKARHGKDTVADFLVRQNRASYNVVEKFSFGAALKQEVEALAEAMGSMVAVHTLFDRAADDHIFFDPHPPMDDPYCPSGKQRGILQWYGTQFWRDIDPDHWVKATAQTLAESRCTTAVIADVRFFNEAKWIREHGGLLVKVSCPNLPECRMLKGHINHQSETELDGFQFDRDITANYGDLTSLFAQATEVFDSYVNRNKKGKP